jgi:hypothetical protein
MSRPRASTHGAAPLKYQEPLNWRGARAWKQCAVLGGIELRKLAGTFDLRSGQAEPNGLAAWLFPQLISLGRGGRLAGCTGDPPCAGSRVPVPLRRQLPDGLVGPLEQSEDPRTPLFNETR